MSTNNFLENATRKPAAPPKNSLQNANNRFGTSLNTHLKRDDVQTTSQSKRVSCTVLVTSATALMYDQYLINGIVVKADTNTHSIGYSRTLADEGNLTVIGHVKSEQFGSDEDAAQPPAKVLRGENFNTSESKWKPRVLSDDNNLKKININNTEIRVTLTKDSLLETVDVPSDIKKESKDKKDPTILSKFICNTLQNSLLEIIDLDPIIAETKKEPTKLIMRTQAKANGFTYLPFASNINQAASVAPFYQQALTNQLFSTCLFVSENSENTIALEAGRTQALNVWSRLADGFDHKRTVQPKEQEKQEECAKFYDGMATAIRNAVAAKRENCESAAGMYNSVENRLLSNKQSMLLIHNPHTFSNEDAGIVELKSGNISPDQMHGLYAYPVMTSEPEVVDTSDMLNLPFTICVHHVPSESFEPDSNGDVQYNTRAFMSCNGSTISELVVKQQLEKLGKMFGGLPKSAAINVAKFLPHLPFMLTVAMDVTRNPETPIREYADNFIIDMPRLLHQRGITVSSEYVKTTINGNSDTFPEFEDNETPYAAQKSERVQKYIQELYTSFTENHFACAMTAAYTTMPLISREFESMKKLSLYKNKSCSLRYAVLPFIDQCTLGQIFGQTKLDASEREKRLDELILSQLKEGETVKDFFKQGRGLLYAYVVCKPSSNN